MIAILGSGFGLYGYLPALVGGCGQVVLLPERYRQRLAARKELAGYAHDVCWRKDEEATLAEAVGVVIALRPMDQAKWIEKCLARANLKYLLLEKPIASSPAAASALQRQLAASEKVIRIGYTFRHTSWGREWLKLGSRNDKISGVRIEWEFTADHFRRSLQSWKRFTDSGGGAVRFYGIQLMALLAEAGYEQVTASSTCGTSENEVESWRAFFEGPGAPSGEIAVNSRAPRARFRVTYLDAREPGKSRSNLFDQADPFDRSEDEILSEGVDRRVPALICLCRDLLSGGPAMPPFYERTIKLWESVENQTRFKQHAASGLRVTE